jgi:predicted enzyme related to lactoylglutathione lyase
MSVRLEAISFDAGDPAALAAFWSELLGREVTSDARGLLLAGNGTQLGLRFVDETTERSKRNRLHVHVTTSSLDDERRIVAAALVLGGRSQGSGHPPIGRDVYLIDPDGNEFCVIEPANQYLAGTGLLGEVTCNGTRAASWFWRQALDWVTVWDEGDQLAIQSPEGGTKIGWDVWPDTKGPGWNRQRFDLVADDVEAAVARLLALGATRIDDTAGAVRMLDPDGSEFSVRAGVVAG